jgi:hypothetical protein
MCNINFIGSLEEEEFSMHIVSSDEMRKLDQYTIEKIGLPAIVLMENAGREATEAIAAYARNTIKALKTNKDGWCLRAKAITEETDWLPPAI